MLDYCSHLHTTPSHPELVNGEGSKVVAEERYTGVEKVVLQQRYQALPRVDHVYELALEQLVAICTIRSCHALSAENWVHGNKRQYF